MMIEVPILNFFLGLVSAIALIVLGFGFRSISRLNDTVIILTQQVGSMNYPLVNKQIIDLEADMVRVWAWKAAEDQKLLNAK